MTLPWQQRLAAAAVCRAAFTDPGAAFQALQTYQECISSQQQWRQIHHVCYWELMWTHSYQQDWLQAYRYASLLCQESRWSKVSPCLGVAPPGLAPPATWAGSNRF